MCVDVGPVEQIGDLDQPPTIGQRATILAVAFQHIEGIQQVAYALAIQDEVAGDDVDRLEYRLRQPNQQALAIDAVDFSASLTDQHPAAIKLLLRRPIRIFQQAFYFLFINRVEQLGENAGNAILLVACSDRVCHQGLRCNPWPSSPGPVS